MDWATGISVSDTTFVAEFGQSRGSRTLLPLSALVKKGVPTSSNFRRQLECDLRAWVAADPARYGSAFGITAEPGKRDGHQVLAFAVKGLEVLVPALALMRAFFRPKRFLLPVMFGPHALDRVCHLDHSTKPPRLVIDANWASPGHSCRYGELSQPLSWLQCFPSAGRMAASVHSFAVEGRIGLDLPEAACQGVITGLRVGDTLFATKVSIVALLALEPPFAFASGHVRQVAFHNVAHDRSVGRRNTVKVDTTIPRHRDGSVEIVDAEWEVLRPILIAGAAATRVELDQRAIANGVLGKLAFGVPWRTATYTEGNWNNARHAYRQWVRRGAFQQAIEALTRLRNHEAG